jgi:thymidylate synthase
MNYEKDYIGILSYILNNAQIKEDRTGVGTLNVLNKMLTVDCSNNKLPILTIRKINYRNAIEEFLFMWRGYTNTKLLEEKGVNIWKGNTSRQFLDKKGLNNFLEGEMGEMYGANLRRFNGCYDQLEYIINTINNDPDSRRITATMQNVAKREVSVLDSCHGVWIQFTANKNTKKLSLTMIQRSADIILGTPTNIIFYSLMLNMVSMITGYNPDKLYIHMIDTHIYSNHVERVEKMLSDYDDDKITIYEEPTFSLKKEIKSIEDVEKLEFDDFIIENYKHNPFIKFNMAV